MEQYLEESGKDINDEELNILDHWYREESRFPILSAMARDILSIPITTVASESAFSAGGRVIDESHSSLAPEMTKVLICCKDWLYGDEEPGNGNIMILVIISLFR